VHAAQVGDDIVLLDVAGDRYLCLPAAGGQARLEAGGRTLILCPQLARTLPASLQAPALEATPAPPGRPVCDLPDSAALEPSAADWRRLALCYADYWRLFAGRSFAAILAGVRRAARPAGRRGAAEAAAVFARLVVWAPVSGQCLVRSFLLMRFILRSGADAEWVFGVRTWPFGAHCWVQAEGVVLDDHAERLAGYVPILAV